MKFLAADDGMRLLSWQSCQKHPQPRKAGRAAESAEAGDGTRGWPKQKIGPKAVTQGGRRAAFQMMFARSQKVAGRGPNHPVTTALKSAVSPASGPESMKCRCLANSPGPLQSGHIPMRNWGGGATQDAPHGRLEAFGSLWTLLQRLALG